jgi:putative endonuclease
VDRGRLGAWGERIAALYLRGRGYRLVARSWRAGRLGEIDLIVERAGVLAFVEVKARSGRRFGSAVEAVGVRKQRRLVRLAEAFVASLPPGSPLRAHRLRLDVVAIERTGPLGWRVRHLPGAFEAGDPGGGAA